MESADAEELFLLPLSLSEITCQPVQARYNKQDLENGDVALLQSGDSHIFSVAMGLKRKHSLAQIINHTKSVRQHWQVAAAKALNMADPWELFHLDELEMQLACRYRYNALKKAWVTDDVLVKIAKEPFNHGAMRECYRMKKMSTFTRKQKWKCASNYVAKKYMQEVDRETYFEDVRLQMDAKLWSEEYDRHNPPKKVDIMQVSVIEFINEPGQLYHMEHFIEGNYVKYNSNSGFISCENVRLTPQAFSHFTFERSGHELIVVDVQGVGDLYTDPQIHTTCGEGFGEGNLGTKGMALFFHSHVCNHICESLGLTPFDLADSEKIGNQKMASLQRYCKTQVRGTEELCMSPTEREKQFLPLYYRADSLETHNEEDNEESAINGSLDDLHSVSSSVDIPRANRRKRYESESSFGNKEEDKLAFQELLSRKSRPSCVGYDAAATEDDLDHSKSVGKSILGQIHLDLVRYYEQGRFSEEGDAGFDHKMALFHLEHSASCGIVEALVALANIHLQLPHNVLEDVSLPKTADSVDKGVDLMVQAASAGDRAAMVFVAKRYDTGEELGSSRSRSWKEAIYWYDLALTMDDSDEDGNFNGCLDDASYSLLARQAEMFAAGGFDLERNLKKAGDLYSSAADAASSAMKGRLASRYYSLAEQVWAEAEE